MLYEMSLSKKKALRSIHSVGNAWNVNEQEEAFFLPYDGRQGCVTTTYPHIHGTFRPFQRYCLVFGLLLVSRLLQYSKHQKVDTYSHVKHMFEQMYVPIFTKNGESREQMVLSKTPIKNNVWKRPSTWSIFWMRMWVSVTNFANKKNFQYVGGRSSILI